MDHRLGFLIFKQVCVSLFLTTSVTGIDRFWVANFCSVMGIDGFPITSRLSTNIQKARDRIKVMQFSVSGMVWISNKQNIDSSFGGRGQILDQFCHF